MKSLSAPTRKGRRGHEGRPAILAVLVLVALGLGVAGCGAAAVRAASGRILVVGAENEYANVLGQIGGRYVTAVAIESNPNADPHTFEASPSVAQTVSNARLVVQNGLGYDDYMNKIEAASPSRDRAVIDVQALLHLPASTPNPHLWYRPGTMPAVARTAADDLARSMPAHAAYFRANLARFDRSLDPWYAALKAFRRSYPGVPVAVTEPVADYMLEAAGARILTPFSLQADIMNGVDPAPQDVSIEQRLLSGHRVEAFLYNQQVTDTLTDGFRTEALRGHVPVVAVYETMPPGYDYQSWMLAEVRALRRAVERHLSTEHL